MKYHTLYNNLSLLNAESLQRLFVAHRRFLDTLIAVIGNESDNSIPQPRLIVGGCGMGKSWLLRALELSLDATVHHIIRTNGKSLSGLGGLEAHFSSGGDKRVILLVDDSESMFDSLSSQEQHTLRAWLNRNGAPILVCTASRVPAALIDYSAAFYDGFAIHHIPTIGMEEACGMISGEDRLRSRAGNLLQILGTEVRNVQLVRNIIQVSSSRMQDEQMLLDQLYPESVLQFGSYPQVSQRIIQCLAMSDEPLSLKELRLQIKAESKELSPYLSKLVKSGDVSVVGNGNRNNKYVLNDKKIAYFLRHIG